MNFPQSLQGCPNQHWGNQRQYLRAVGQSFYLGDSETYGNKVCTSMSLNLSWGITTEGWGSLFPECSMILEPGGTWFLSGCCQFLTHLGQVSAVTRRLLPQTVSSAVPGQQACGEPDSSIALLVSTSCRHWFWMPDPTVSPSPSQVRVGLHGHFYLETSFSSKQPCRLLLHFGTACV